MKNKGITLISLVVTVIVLLILAGITIGMLTSNNNILSQSHNAKIETEIAGEKEILQLATYAAMAQNKEGYIEKGMLCTELNKYPEVDTTEEVDEGVEVTFKCGRTYIVGADGNVREEIIVDRTGINVGDYITYISPTESVTLSTTETGYTSEQILPQKTLFRVLDIDKRGNMTLIGAMTSTDKQIYFSGALGYNNAVYTLNTKCSELYKDTSKGITARSIKVEDITDRFNQTGKDKLTNAVDTQMSLNVSIGTYSINIDKINKTVTYTSARGYYPDIFQYETNGKIDENATSGEINQSESYYSQATNNTYAHVNTSLTIPYTYYRTEHMSSDFLDTDNATNYQNIFFGTNTSYWVASRCNTVGTDIASFNLRRVDLYRFSGGSGKLFDSYYNTYTEQCRVCPIITIPSTVKVTPCSGINSASNPHIVVIE